MSSIIISTSYLPPIQYISKFLLYEEVVVEKFENYQKQSYRNRCYIYGANGKQCLTIPVKKQHGEKTPVTEVEIDHNYNWQKIHLKSIESAYRLSAFFEYYMDDILPLYTRKIPLLFDWNSMLLKTVLKLSRICDNSVLSDRYVPYDLPDDYRQSISPKERLHKPDPHFHPYPYQQVFIERYGFLPNLSIIDLIFNEGPQTHAVLRKSIV